MIDSIHIQGFKKLHVIDLHEMRSINYLVGSNGSGKSSIIEILTLIGNYGLFANVLLGQAVSLFGNPKDIFHATASVVINATLAGVPGNIDSYTFNVGTIPAEIIKRNSSSGALALVTRGFILTSLRNATYFNSSNPSYQHGILELLTFNVDDIIIDRELVKNFLNDNFFNSTKNESPIVRIYRSITPDKSIQIEKEDGTVINFKALSGGQLSLLGLYFSITDVVGSLVSNAPSKVLLISLDEPENTFHPDLQKNINNILKRIVDETLSLYGMELQFIVTTHSPFIIKSIEGDFTKVYLLKNGETVKMNEQPGRSNGFNNSMCVGVASKMLGAGLNDLSPDVRIPKLPTNQIRIIYCEGDNGEADAIFYNLIFPEFQGIKNHFISCKGGNHVVSQYFIGREAANLLGGTNTIVLGLVDRSNSYGGFIIGDEIIKTDGISLFTDDERSKFLAEYPGIKMLKRREIENYLYDPEILTKLGTNFTEILESLKTFIGTEIKSQIQNISVLDGLSKLDLAKAITPDTRIYNELAECIFN